MKLRTKIIAWVWTVALACLMLLCIILPTHYYLFPPKMAFLLVASIFIIGISFPLFVGCLGLLESQKWAWWLLVVLFAMMVAGLVIFDCYPFSRHDLTQRFANGLPYLCACIVTLAFLLTDRPNAWTKRLTE